MAGLMPKEALLKLHEYTRMPQDAGVLALSDVYIPRENKLQIGHNATVADEFIPIAPPNPQDIYWGVPRMSNWFSYSYSNMTIFERDDGKGIDDMEAFFTGAMSTIFAYTKDALAGIYLPLAYKTIKINLRHILKQGEL
jgi:hypothetical protein